MTEERRAKRIKPSKFAPPPKVDYAVVINDVADMLERNGVPREILSDENRLEYGWKLASLSSHVSIFRQFTDDEKARQVLFLGLDRGYYQSFRQVKPEQFFAFLEFLKTPKGQEALHQLQVVAKLEKRGGGNFDAPTQAWLNMAEELTSIMSNEITQIRRVGDTEIAALVAQLRARRRRLADDIAAVKVKYPPMGGYVSLSDREIRRRCWAHFLSVCRDQGLEPGNKNDKNMDEAVTQFGALIRNRHLLEYLEVDERKQQLADYFEANIARFRQ